MASPGWAGPASCSFRGAKGSESHWEQSPRFAAFFKTWGLRKLDKRIYYLCPVVIRNARRMTLHVLHQTVQIIFRSRDTDHPDGGAIPKIRRIELRDRYVEMSAQPVFQAAYDLAFVL